MWCSIDRIGWNGDDPTDVSERTKAWVYCKHVCGAPPYHDRRIEIVAALQDAGIQAEMDDWYVYVALDDEARARGIVEACRHS